MKPLPKVLILATGGTIAGVAPSSTQPGYTSGKIDINGMIRAVPNLEKLARVKGEQFSNVGSQDMSFEIMINLAHRINELLTQDEIEGHNYWLVLFELNFCQTILLWAQS